MQGKGGGKVGGGEGRGAIQKKGEGKAGGGRGRAVAQGKGGGKAGRGQGMGASQASRGGRSGGGGKVRDRGLGRGVQGHKQERRRSNQGQEYRRGSRIFSRGSLSGVGGRGGRGREGTSVWRTPMTSPFSRPWDRHQGGDDGGTEYQERPELPYPEHFHEEPWQEDRCLTEWQPSAYELPPSSADSVNWKQPYGGWGVVAQNQPSKTFFPPEPVPASYHPSPPPPQPRPPPPAPPQSRSLPAPQHEYHSTPISLTHRPLEQPPTLHPDALPRPPAQQSMISAGPSSSSSASASSTQGPLEQLLQVLNASPESDVLQNLVWLFCSMVVLVYLSPLLSSRLLHW